MNPEEATRPALYRLGRADWLALALWAVMGILLLPDNHFESEDTFKYVLCTEMPNHGYRDGFGSCVLHHNHLYYVPLTKVVYGAAQALGYSGRATRPMQLFSLAAAVLTLAMLMMWVGGRNGPWRGRLVAALYAATFGFWYYSLEADVYTLPLPVLLAALWRADTASEPADWITVGVLYGVCVLLHQSNVLFLAVLLPMWYFRGRSVRGLIALGASSALVVGVPYIATIIVDRHPQNLQDLLANIAGRPGSHSRWGEWRSSTPFRLLMGLGRTLAGNHGIMAIEPVREAMRRMMPNSVLVEEVWVVRNMGLGTAIALPLLSIVAALGYLVVLFRALRGWRRNPYDRPLLTSLIVWALAYGVFFAWWEPHNIEFWIASLLPLLLMIGMGPANPGLRLGFAAAALLLAVNLFGSMLPLKPGDSDYYRVWVRPLEQFRGRATHVIESGDFNMSIYTRFYSGLEAVDLNHIHSAREARQRVRDQVGHLDPSRVLVSDSLLVREPLIQPLYGKNAEYMRDLFAWLKPYLDPVAEGELQTVYALRAWPPDEESREGE